MKKTILIICIFIGLLNSQAQVTFTNTSGDGLWSTAGNWSSGSLPGPSDNVSIENYVVTLDTDANVNNLTLSMTSAFTKLTIESDASLTLEGNLSISGGLFDIESSSTNYGSLIVKGSSSGTVNYLVYVNSVNSGWDLVGSPLSNVTIASITSNSNIATQTNNGVTTYAFGYHDNTIYPNAVSNNNGFTNYTSDTNSGLINVGQGYQMGTNSGGTVKFAGNVLSSNQTISIQNRNAAETANNSYSGSRWNLISNPFPSYLNGNLPAAGGGGNTNHFLNDTNLSQLNPNFQAIYGFNANTGYTIINNISSATYLAPGQAFFVASKVGDGSLDFDINMRTTSNTDNFIQGRLAQNTSQEFYLRLYEQENLVNDSRFYFEDGLSLGLDPGYDAGAFDQNLDIVSRLPENDEGIGFSINAMSLDNLEDNILIPLVFNRPAGVEFIVSFEDSSIPEGLDIYLEDTEAESFTNLRTDDFILTPESDLSSVGRFYLNIGSNNLGDNDLTDSYFNIYKLKNSDYITIEGLSNTLNANIKIYNTIGQEVLNDKLKSDQSRENFPVIGLTSGVYIVKLEVDNSVITKKIIIN